MNKHAYVLVIDALKSLCIKWSSVVGWLLQLCHYLESGTQLSHSPLPELSLFGDVMIFAVHYEIISRHILSTLRNSGNSGAIKIISIRQTFRSAATFTTRAKDLTILITHLVQTCENYDNRLMKGSLKVIKSYFWY